MKRFPPYISGICKSLRRESTSSEELLWRYLKGRKLSGYKFRRQHPFGRYIVDFCCLDAGLVVEIDGLGHSLVDQVEYDRIRSEALALDGFKVLRFTNEQVMSDTESVLLKILNTLAPFPSP